MKGKETMNPEVLKVLMPMMLQMCQDYYADMRAAMLKQTLTSRFVQPYKIEQNYSNMSQNLPNMMFNVSALANGQSQQQQQFNPMQMMQSLISQAPQQGQGNQPPPPPGHYEWDQTTQAYNWIPNP
jgi:hypothetical protein